MKAKSLFPRLLASPKLVFILAAVTAILLFGTAISAGAQTDEAPLSSIGEDILDRITALESKAAEIEDPNIAAEAMISVWAVRQALENAIQILNDGHKKKQAITPDHHMNPTF